MKTWQDRAKERMKELGINQNKLAELVGATQSSISHALVGIRRPPQDKMEKIARVLKMTPAQLLYGVTEKTIPLNSKKQTEKLQIPIIPLTQAEKFLNSPKTFSKKEFIPIFIQAETSRKFAIRMKGDFMTNPAHPKSIHADELLIIDPSRDAKDGDIVLAKLGKSKEPTIKQYVVDGDISYLRSLNPEYRATPMDKKSEILGVVIMSVKTYLI